MALFSRKPKKEAPKTADVAAEPKVSGIAQTYAHLLHNPRITEKASAAMEGFVYVFDVASSANKRQVKAAVESVYKVKPRKVAIVNTKAKIVRNMRTGQKGMKGGGKKAYVYLQKGETITVA
jgi:large subunit ribosomal protein L23